MNIVEHLVARELDVPLQELVENKTELKKNIDLNMSDGQKQYSKLVPILPVSTSAKACGRNRFQLPNQTGSG